jgi:hypothetical protein
MFISKAESLDKSAIFPVGSIQGVSLTFDLVRGGGWGDLTIPILLTGAHGKRNTCINTKVVNLPLDEM